MKFNIKKKLKFVVSSMLLVTSLTLTPVEANDQEGGLSSSGGQSQQVMPAGSTEPTVDALDRNSSPELNPATQTSSEMIGEQQRPSDTDDPKEELVTSKAEVVTTNSETSETSSPTAVVDEKVVKEDRGASAPDQPEEAQKHEETTQVDKEKKDSKKEETKPTITQEEAQTLLKNYKGADSSQLSKESKAYLKKLLNNLEQLLKQKMPGDDDPSGQARYHAKLNQACNALRTFELTQAEGKKGNLQAPDKAMLEQVKTKLETQLKAVHLLPEEAQIANQLVLQADKLLAEKTPDLYALKRNVEALNAFLEQLPRTLTIAEKESLLPEIQAIEHQVLNEKLAKKASLDAKVRQQYDSLRKTLEEALQEAKKLTDVRATRKNAPNNETVNSIRAKLVTAKEAYLSFIKDHAELIDTDYTAGEKDQEFNVYHNQGGFPIAKLDKGSEKAPYVVTNQVPIDLTFQLVSNKGTGKVALEVTWSKKDGQKVNVADLQVPGFLHQSYEKSEGISNGYRLYYKDIPTRFTTAQVLFHLLNGDYHDGITLSVLLKQVKEDGSLGEILAQKSLSFLVTKSGYEDYPLVGPGGSFGTPGSGHYSNPFYPGSDSYGKEQENEEGPYDPGAVDGEGKVLADKAKAINFLNQLLKNSQFMDKKNLLVVGPNDAVPLQKVRVEVAVPESDGMKAQHILNKAGINYQLIDGKLVLDLELAKIKGLSISRSGDRLLVDGKVLGTFEKVTKVLYRNAEGKLIYIDEKGDEQYVAEVDERVLKGTAYKLVGKDTIVDNKGKIVAKLIGDYLVDPDGNYLKVDKNKFEVTTEKIRYRITDDQLFSFTGRYHELIPTMRIQKVQKTDPETKKVTDKIDLSVNTVKVEGNYLKSGDNFYGKILTPGTYVTDPNGHVIEGATWQEHAVFDSLGKFIGTANVAADGTMTFRDGSYKIKNLGSKTHPDWVIVHADDGEVSTLRYVEEAGVDKSGYQIGQAKRLVASEDEKSNVVVDKRGRVIQNFHLVKKADGKYYLVEAKAQEGQNPREILLGEGNLKIEKANGTIYVAPGNKILTDKDFPTDLKNEDYRLDESGNLMKKSTLGKLTKLGQIDYSGYNKVFDIAREKKSYYKTQVTTNGKTEEKIVEVPADVPMRKGQPDQWLKKADGTVLIYDNGNVYDQAGGLLYSSKAQTLVQQLMADGSKRLIEGADLFTLVNQTDLTFTFKGFRTGDHVHHIYQTRWEVYYSDPQTGEMKSIFKDKVFHTYHTFRLKAVVIPNDFSKIPPHELSGSEKMDFELFNLLYRKKGDRKRSDFLLQYLTQEKLKELEAQAKMAEEKAKEAAKKAQVASEEEKEAIEKSRNAAEAEKKQIEAEVSQLKKNFTALTGKKLSDKLTTVQENKARDLLEKYKKLTGKSLALNKEGDFDTQRELEWILNYNNQSSQLTYPDDYNQQLVFYDSHLDNRLIYKDLIFKAPEKDINEWAVEAFKAKREFKVPENLFGIDQVDRILLGVNPYIKRSDFHLVDWKEDLMAEYKKVKAAMAAGRTVDSYLTIDKMTGTVRINLMKLFYGDGNSDETLILKQYEEQLGKLREIFRADNPKTQNIDGIKAALEEAELKGAPKQSPCLHEIQLYLEDRVNKGQSIAELKAAVNRYLDSIVLGEDKHHPFNKSNTIFNAFQIAFKKGVGVPAGSTRRVIVTSVIKPHVDIPYTDAYGDPLTNWEMYQQQALRKLFQEGKNEFDADKLEKAGLTFKNKKTVESLSDAQLRQLYDYLVQKVGELKKDNKVKELVEKDDQGETAFAYKPIVGSTLGQNDLLDKNGKPMTDQAGLMVNPNYRKNPKYSGQPKENEYYNLKEFLGADSSYAKKRLNLIGYYLHTAGYSGRWFGNAGAEYLLGQAEGIRPFKPGYSWKNVYCGLGLGHCITETGEGTGEPGSEHAGKRDHFSKKVTRVEISHTPETSTGDNHNKIGKKTVTPGTYMPGNRVDFEIGATLDMLDLTTIEENGKIESGNNKWQLDKEERKKYGESGRGYYLLKDGYIIEFLPNDLEYDDQSKVTVTPNWQHLRHYDPVTKTYDNANANRFDTEEKRKAFQNGIRLTYVTDLKTYLNSLPENSLIRQKLAGMTEDLLKRHAVIIQLPEFEVPNFNGKGADLFTIKAQGLKVKEATWGEKENEAHFFSTPWSGGATSTYKVGQGKSKANKYMRWYVPNAYDQQNGRDGTPTDWKQGQAKLTPGQRYDYKLEYTYQALATDKFGVQTGLRNLEITDFLPEVTDGLKPYLLGPIRIDQAAGSSFEITYQVGKDWKTAEQVTDFKEVTGIRIVQVKGARPIEPGSTVSFILPMRVPSVTLKVDKDGKPIVDKDKKPQYEGLDRFDWDKMLGKNKFKTNEGGESNEVTVQVDKTTFMHFHKTWHEAKRQEDGSYTFVEHEPTVAYVAVEIYQTATVETDETAKDASSTSKASNPTLYKTIYLNAANKWNAVVSGLPTVYEEYKIVTAADGTVTKTLVKKIVYTYTVKEVLRDLSAYIEEKAMEESDISVNGGTAGKSYRFFNLYNRTKVTAKKTWKNGQNKRPDSLSLQLKQDGKSYRVPLSGTVGKDAESSTDYVWENLPLFQDENGSLIVDKAGNPVRHVYTVVELNANGEEVALVGPDGKAITNPVYKNGEVKFTFTITGDMDKGFTLTNTYLVPKRKVEATKKWVNGSAARTRVYFKLFRKVGEGQAEAVGDLKAVGTADEAQVTWTDLDNTDAQGNEYTYFVKEVDANGKDFTPANFKKEENGLTVTNTYVVPKTKVEVKKVWVNGPDVKPTITIHLLRDGQVLRTIQLTNGQTTYVWTDLDATDSQGKAYAYTVKEDAVEHYSAEITGTMAEGFTLTNTYVSPKKEVTATKKWVNGSAARPRVYFKLFRKVGEGQAEAVGEVKAVGTADEAQVTWTDLDKTDAQGNEYTYFVKEVDANGKDFTPANFKKEENGLTVTNTYVSPKKEVTATKKWVNGSAARPRVYFKLFRKVGEGQAEAVGEVKAVGTADEAQVTWTDLDKTDAQGNEYTYFVKEVDANGTDFTPANFEKEENGLKVTNTYVVPKTKLAVKKIWVNAPDVKPTITIHLLRNGQVLGTIQLANGQTTYVWTDLDATDNQGKAYAYTVKEDAIEHYSAEITGTMAEGFTLTNTYHPPYTPLTLEFPGKPNKPEEPSKPEKTTNPKEPEKPEKTNPTPTPRQCLPQTGERSEVWRRILALVMVIAGMALWTGRTTKE